MRCQLCIKRRDNFQLFPKHTNYRRRGISRAEIQSISLQNVISTPEGQCDINVSVITR